ncbi:hypothetical protein HHK36_020908 [Tetracentron sinense]|uniref:Uncharacterized protein n=1 Tax=Tetracentron sinense TaxID=13715 RepID=A0A834YXW8_TETSI|nr:hypothetical protein HHK36_020908 [Tetracentron sinense]
MEPSNNQNLHGCEDRTDETPVKISVSSPTFELENITKEISSKFMESDSSAAFVEDRISKRVESSKSEIVDRIEEIVVEGLDSGFQRLQEESRWRGFEESNESENNEMPCQGGFMICLCLFKLAAYALLFVFLFCCLLLVINRRSIFIMKTVLILLIAMGFVLVTLQADAKRFILEEHKMKVSAHLGRKVGGGSNGVDEVELTGKMGTAGYGTTGAGNIGRKLNSDNSETSDDDEKNESYGSHGHPSGSTTDTHHVYPDDDRQPKH